VPDGRERGGVSSSASSDGERETGEVVPGGPEMVGARGEAEESVTTTRPVTLPAGPAISLQA